MKPMPLNLVDDIDDVKKKGDACMVTGRNKQAQLIICCPGCGNNSASRGNHIFDPSTNSYHPSIVHNKKFGGCGWHGWLRNGIFTSV